jgi:Ca-activated chloride channel family protein
MLFYKSGNFVERTKLPVHRKSQRLDRFDAYANAVPFKEEQMRYISCKKIAMCLLLIAMLLPGCRKKEEAPPAAAPEAAAPAPLSPETDTPVPMPDRQPDSPAEYNTEGYGRISENPFLDTLQNPLSTFSLDVDTASYANVRRFITNGSLPPPDAVRIEEMVNYFDYKYPKPKGDEPFSFTTELTDAPWKPENKLLLIGLQGVKVPMDKLPPANLVFLIDVSGSMEDENKLPLLVRSLKLLVGKLRPNDRVAIVVYAGKAGLVLPSTRGDKKKEIRAALDGLSAGGSTAGGEGIELAYKIARKNFVSGGNNRVILATDGDFNVGVSSDAEMERLIEEKRKDGVFLSVLGFGMGNYQDSKMQKLADKGNGNYAYIDTFEEATKVLGTQFGGTMMTIAKDVKLQVEFNPAKVKSYRLIGYEKRILRREDFSDDKKDAGELGSGHTVTALYEIVPAKSRSADTQELTYQTVRVKENARKSPELATIRFRYKKPDGKKSIELVRTIPATSVALDNAGENIRFAAAVAEWGMLLRNSEHKGKASRAQVLELAESARGDDDHGYRAEFIELVGMTKKMGRK